MTNQISLLIIQSLYFMLPAYFANMLPSILRNTKILTKPLDFNKTFIDSKPLFGTHKTFRLILSPIIALVIFSLQKYFYYDFPNIYIYNYTLLPISFGFFIGLGAILGDLLKSFCKRRIDIKEGKNWIILDQIDFIAGTLFVCYFYFIPKLTYILVILITSIIVHITSNILGKFIGLNKKKLSILPQQSLLSIPILFLIILSFFSISSAYAINYTITKTSNKQYYLNNETILFTINLTNIENDNITYIDVYDYYVPYCLNYSNSTFSPNITNQSSGYIYWRNLSCTPLTTNHSCILEINFSIICINNTSLDIINNVSTHCFNNTVWLNKSKTKTITILANNSDLYEYDNNFGNASLIQFNILQNRTLTLNDTDYIAFTIQNTTYDMNAHYLIRTYVYGSTDTTITLYNPSRDPIADNDDISVGNNRASAILFSPSTNGTYYIKVEPFESFIGDYQILLEKQGIIEFTNFTTSSTVVNFSTPFIINTTIKCLYGRCKNITLYLDPIQNKINLKKIKNNPSNKIANKTTLILKINKKQLQKQLNITSNVYSKSINSKINTKSKPQHDNESQIRPLSIQLKLNNFDNQIKTLENKKIIKNNKKIYETDNYLMYKFDITDIANINPILDKLLEQDINFQLYEDRIMHLFLDLSVPKIQADKVWNITINNHSINGSGYTVCVIDTGVDYTHSDFRCDDSCTFPTDKIIGGYDFVNDDNDPMDDHGHGTHVAGIVASEDTTYRGVAPGVKIIAIKALNSAGYGSESDIISALDWCINNASIYNITAISMSLGDETNKNYLYCDDDAMANAIADAYNHNITIVISAGNSGWKGPIARPACVSKAIAVGSIDDLDNILYNRGFITDLLAPGYNIMATDYGTPSSHTQKSGTSMSTPHVSGVVALLNQYYKLRYNHSLTPEEIRIMLRSQGINIYENTLKLNITRIDALEAINNSKGIIPVGSGKPFYTNINPHICDLDENQSCNLSWIVRANGEEFNNQTFSFFSIAYFNDYREQKESNKINITIFDTAMNITLETQNQSFFYSLVDLNFSINSLLGTVENCSLYLNNTLNNTLYNLTPNQRYNFTLNFSCEQCTYSWYIKCENNNRSSITETRIFYIDKIPFGLVENVYAYDTPNDNGGSITINWSNSINGTLINNTLEFHHYNVYRSTSNFSNIQNATFLASTTSNIYTDESSTDGQSYYYAITAIDKARNQNFTVVPYGPVESIDNLGDEDNGGGSSSGGASGSSGGGGTTITITPDIIINKNYYISKNNKFFSKDITKYLTTDDKTKKIKLNNDNITLKAFFSNISVNFNDLNQSYVMRIKNIKLIRNESQLSNETKKLKKFLERRNYKEDQIIDLLQIYFTNNKNNKLNNKQLKEIIDNVEITFKVDKNKLDSINGKEKIILLKIDDDTTKLNYLDYNIYEHKHYYIYKFNVKTLSYFIAYFDTSKSRSNITIFDNMTSENLTQNNISKKSTKTKEKNITEENITINNTQQLSKKYNDSYPDKEKETSIKNIIKIFIISLVGLIIILSILIFIILKKAPKIPIQIPIQEEYSTPQKSKNNNIHNIQESNIKKKREQLIKSFKKIYR